MNEVRRRLLMDALKLIDLGLGLIVFAVTSSFVLYPHEPFSMARFMSSRITVSEWSPLRRFSARLALYLHSLRSLRLAPVVDPSLRASS